METCEICGKEKDSVYDNANKQLIYICVNHNCNEFKDKWKVYFGGIY